MSRRIFVHPGHVVSERDGDRHFIGFIELCRLYKVNPQGVINAQMGVRGYGQEEGDIHLYPLRDGKYPLFDKEGDG